MAGNPIKRSAREAEAQAVRERDDVSDAPLTRDEAIRLASRTARALTGTRDCIPAIELALDLMGIGVKAVAPKIDPPPPPSGAMGAALAAYDATKVSINGE